MSIQNISNKLERIAGQKNQIEKDIEENNDQINYYQKQISYSEKAQLILQTVAQQTQEQLEYKLSEIVTLALQSIFDDPYEFKVRFDLKRGKTECGFYLEKNGKEYNPTKDTGGGVVDIVSFALRIVMWSLKKPRARNTIILDEPFRFLSKDLQPKASLLLKELSDKLKLQFIMVSHSEDLIEGADKVFKVIQRRGISKVKEI